MKTPSKKAPSKKAQGLIEDYIESSGSDRAVFEYILELETVVEAALAWSMCSCKEHGQALAKALDKAAPLV